MGYKVDFDALDTLCVSISSQVNTWAESLDAVSSGISAVVQSSDMTGKGAENIKSYLQSVHLSIMQSLAMILQSHSSYLLKYKSDYQTNIDTSLHAVIQSDELFDIRKNLGTKRTSMWTVNTNIKNALTSVNDIIYTNLRSKDDMEEMYQKISTDLLNLESDISTLENTHLNNDFSATEEMIETLKTFIKEQLQNTKEYLVEYTPEKLANSKTYAALYIANTALAEQLEQRADELELAYEHESNRAKLLEEEAAQKREEEGWWNAVLAVGTIVIGTVAIVCTAGAATPIVVTAAIAGGSTIAYGTSNLIEASQDIYYGSIGDAHTVAFNPIRDTIFMGNQEAYDLWGGISTTVAGLIVPVGQTYTAAKAVGQTGKTLIGTVGKSAVKEVAQDALVGAASSKAGSLVMNLTGDANLSRLAGLGTGILSGSKTGKALNSIDNAVSSSVKTLNQIDDVADTAQMLDQVPKRPSWRQSELDVQKEYPDYEPQKSFKDGVEVPYGTKGSTRPELYKSGHSIEVKNYNVETTTGQSNLVNKRKRKYLFQCFIHKLIFSLGIKSFVMKKGESYSGVVLRWRSCGVIID